MKSWLRHASVLAMTLACTAALAQAPAQAPVKRRFEGRPGGGKHRGAGRGAVRRAVGRIQARPGVQGSRRALRSADRRRAVLRGCPGQLRDRRPHVRRAHARGPDAEAHRHRAEGGLQVAPARSRHQDDARQRLAHDRHLRGSELPVLQAAVADDGGPEGRDDLHVPLPDPVGRLGRQVEGDLVLEGSRRGVGPVHGRRQGARALPRKTASIRSTRTSRSAARSASTARRRSSSPTVRARPARCPCR